MPNFEKPTTPEEQAEQLSTPEQNDVPEQGEQGPEDELSPESLQEKFKQQDAQSDEVIGQVNGLLDHIDGIDNEEPEVTEQLNKETGGFLRKIGKIKVLKEALTLLTLLAPATAQAGTLDAVREAVTQTQTHNEQQSPTYNTALEQIRALAGNTEMVVTKTGKIKNRHYHYAAHGDTRLLEKALKTLQGAQNPREQVLLENIDDTKIGTSSHVNKLNAVPIRLHRMGEEYPTVNSLDGAQQNILRNRKILQGVTVNGSPVYEIAPGVYGNEHSQYGDGVSIGTIEIGN